MACNIYVDGEANPRGNFPVGFTGADLERTYGAPLPVFLRNADGSKGRNAIATDFVHQQDFIVVPPSANQGPAMDNILESVVKDMKFPNNYFDEFKKVVISKGEEGQTVFDEDDVKAIALNEDLMKGLFGPNWKNIQKKIVQFSSTPNQGSAIKYLRDNNKLEQFQPKKEGKFDFEGREMLIKKATAALLSMYENNIDHLMMGNQKRQGIAFCGGSGVGKTALTVELIEQCIKYLKHGYTSNSSVNNQNVPKLITCLENRLDIYCKQTSGSKLLYKGETDEEEVKSWLAKLVAMFHLKTYPTNSTFTN
eukprot:TRINITY_DN2577_c1_g2_i1.p1 TRINITY_DN2577_c1_g2~~TRINITY_DN2577_c1_g2_i1.p1  ORF type:complete len:308 (+),score=62.40 TRINITY_DN2577_c1_g2_i1:208-1131(+)